MKTFLSRITLLALHGRQIRTAFLALGALTLFMFGSVESRADTTLVSANVVSGASPELLEAIFKACDIEYRKAAKGVYTFNLGGKKVIASAHESHLKLTSFFRGSPTSLRRVNAWNNEKSFSRAYVDDDGDAVIQSEILFEGGVTLENLAAYLTLFKVSVQAFASHLSD